MSVTRRIGSSKLWATVAVLISCFALGERLSASVITILNPSFELDNVPASPGYTIGVVDWASNGAGVYDFNDAAPGALPTPTDGHQFAWINQTNISQVLSTNLAPDTQYTLRADFSAAASPTTTYTLGLYVGPTLLAVSNTLTPTAYSWTTTTVTYLSPSVVAPGQALMVKITDAAPQLLVDNVHLDAVVPEPTGAACLVAGGLAFSSIRSRRRRSR